MAVEITAVGRYRLAALHRMVDKYGSQKEAAKRLGVSSQTFNAWLNLKRFPRLGVAPWPGKKADKLEADILNETGLTIDLIWPKELTDAIAKEAIPSTFAKTQAVEVQALEHYGSRTVERLEYHGDPVNQFVVEERTEGVRNVLQQMARAGDISFREKTVLTHRFGLDGNAPMTLGEVAKTMGITRERVRQIEAKVIRKMQQPGCASRLVEFADAS